MTKNQLTENLLDWLRAYITNDLFNKYELLDIFAPNTALSRINNSFIKKFANYSAFDFTPDIVAVVGNKETNELQTIMINRYINTISLRDIGEAYIYAKLSKSPIFFIISSKGVSSEVSILLISDKTRNSLLEINSRIRLHVASYDESRSTVDFKSMISCDGFGKSEK